ncbi:unnamed protein product [Soboliphyme baturini]|uniref:Succinate dehydrogenase n=1 Tax=Soboliphyme baturini TaxID=241478 RepID=A0A183IZA1_9BILA|nr:unnamed protein product [Soboliphyme baturini]
MHILYPTSEMSFLNKHVVFRSGLIFVTLHVYTSLFSFTNDKISKVINTLYV